MVAPALVTPSRLRRSRRRPDTVATAPSAHVTPSPPPPKSGKRSRSAGRPTWAEELELSFPMVDKYEERQAKAEEAKARKARKAAAEAEAEAEEAKTKPKKKKKKVLPKNQARIAKNECERKRYCLMSEKDHEKIKARSLACQEKHRQALRENLEASEKHRKKDRERKKKSAQYAAIARIHNDCYRSPKDRMSATLRERTGVLVGGKVVYEVYMPERVTSLSSNTLSFSRDAATVAGEGFYQTITFGSVVKLVRRLMLLVPAAHRHKFRHMNTVDLGAGLMLLSLVFSQYLLTDGGHFGIECQKALVHQSKINIKNITAKGISNWRKGDLRPETVLEQGELQHVIPPNVIPVHGYIEDIEDLSIFDLAIGFDDVNSPETFRSLAKIWNKRESKMCKFFITNATPEQLDDCGFTDIIWKDEVRCNFSQTGATTETRVFHVYMREVLKGRAVAKWRFEHEHQVTAAKGPFREPWEKFCKGRRRQKLGLPFNPEVVQMSKEFDEEIGWMDERPRSTRANICYKE